MVRYAERSPFSKQRYYQISFQGKSINACKMHEEQA